jgi:hypothetical protein
MTYQKDPAGSSRIPTFMRAADGTWNVLPLLLAAAALLIGGYALWGGNGYLNRSTPTATQQSTPDTTPPVKTQ